MSKIIFSTKIKNSKNYIGSILIYFLVLILLILLFFIYKYSKKEFFYNIISQDVNNQQALSTTPSTTIPSKTSSSQTSTSSSTSPTMPSLIIPYSLISSLMKSESKNTPSIIPESTTTPYLIPISTTPAFTISATTTLPLTLPITPIRTYKTMNFNYLNDKNYDKNILDKYYLNDDKLNVLNGSNRLVNHPYQKKNGDIYGKLGLNINKLTIDNDKFNIYNNYKKYGIML